jgi:hypothetical protein
VERSEGVGGGIAANSEGEMCCPAHPSQGGRAVVERSSGLSGGTAAYAARGSAPRAEHARQSRPTRGRPTRREVAQALAEGRRYKRDGAEIARAQAALRRARASARPAAA